MVEIKVGRTGERLKESSDAGSSESLTEPLGASLPDVATLGFSFERSVVSELSPQAACSQDEG